MDIKLNFINAATGTKGVDVVFFQKNKGNFMGSAIAWKVLKNTSNGWGTPFDFSTGYHVAVQNADGAPTPQLAAVYGDKFIVEKDGGSMKLLSAGKGTDLKQITILNDLPDQSINALVYKDEDLIAKEDGGAPGRTATFQMGHNLWVGVCDGVEQGETMRPNLVASLNTKINLLGIKSADIVMRKTSPSGGNGNADANPANWYEFTLENVVHI